MSEILATRPVHLSVEVGTRDPLHGHEYATRHQAGAWVEPGRFALPAVPQDLLGNRSDAWHCPTWTDAGCGEGERCEGDVLYNPVNGRVVVDGCQVLFESACVAPDLIFRLQDPRTTEDDSRWYYLTLQTDWSCSTIGDGLGN